ncbi:MAG TPA: YitT family protein [Anaerolineales bacterium]|nr:YitT family protein [Anaerolineales bacterium]
MPKLNFSSLKDFFFIFLGSTAQAIALRLFFVPADLASGGVSGIAQLINHYTDWQIGLMVFIGNLPLFALGWKHLGGRKFASRTIFAIVTFSLLTDLLPFIPYLPNDGLTHDMVLNSLYGAVIAGFGYGLVYKGQGTSGGSDILARILSHHKGIPVTQSYLMTDAIVVLGAGFVFGWDKALYAIITLYVSGLVVDTTMDGSGTVRTAMIITSQPKTVAKSIMELLERGVTTLQGTGEYTGEIREVVYVVVTRSEVQMLKSIVHETDPDAFMVVGAAHEVLGEGFATFTK